MKIHENFVGGNIRVLRVEGDVVSLDNDLRDTQGDWFYWAFCVEGAEGRTLTFKMPPNRVGAWGPAVSYDLKAWHWLDSCDGDSFTYRFGAEENKVYFAHHILYHPDRFFAFARSRGLDVRELCKSRKGRSVPCVSFGEGDISVILTARHHACESAGSYVLEGVIAELCDAPITNTRAFCVPFVDYDGVVDGDQGKGRAPHDHNRDYTDTPIYPETASIYAYAEKNGCNYGFDFHSPWHRGGDNDNIFIVRNSAQKLDDFNCFSAMLESQITQRSMFYQAKNDYPPMTGWNRPAPTFGFTMNSRPECKLAFSLENTYFGTAANKVSADRLVELGRCFARAVKTYIEGNVR